MNKCPLHDGLLNEFNVFEKAITFILLQQELIIGSIKQLRHLVIESRSVIRAIYLDRSLSIGLIFELIDLYSAVVNSLTKAIHYQRLVDILENRTGFIVQFRRTISQVKVQFRQIERKLNLLKLKYPQIKEKYKLNILISKPIGIDRFL